jgi:UDP-N-acetyl-D-mannosaminuronate dehydrogenase
MNIIRTASVCGLGRLGAFIVATPAARGFDVVGVDIDREKVTNLRETD